MTDRELMQQTLDALVRADRISGYPNNKEIIIALRSRLEQCDRCGKSRGGEGHIHTCSPQPAAWQGLTDEEITNLHHEIKVRLMGSYKTVDLYRAIEAKLKGKNT